MAMSDDISWDSQEIGLRQRTGDHPHRRKAIPDGYEFDPAQQALIAGTDPIGISLASFLYGNEAETGPALEIPAKFTDHD